MRYCRQAARCDKASAPQPPYMCLCDQGWTKGFGQPACSVDVDECATGHHFCSRNPPVACINFPGGFGCGPCPSGQYLWASRLCVRRNQNDDQLACSLGRLSLSFFCQKTCEWFFSIICSIKACAYSAGALHFGYLRKLRKFRVSGYKTT